MPPRVAAHLCRRVCRAHHIEHRLIRPFRPQTNGMVERFNRRLSEALRSRPQIKSNWSTNRFHNHEQRNRFIYTFVQNYNRTRLKCLGYKSPNEVLSDQAVPNTVQPSDDCFCFAAGHSRASGNPAAPEGGEIGSFSPPLNCIQHRLSFTISGLIPLGCPVFTQALV